jgi:hypothetical protein
MDMELMNVVSAFAAITLPIMVTILLSGRQTQRIIQTSNQQTQRILRKLERCLVKISATQEEIKELQQDMHRCLLKLDFGFKVNALMHGWRREDNVTPERAKQLPEPKIYDEGVGVCYFKPIDPVGCSAIGNTR